MLLSEITLAGPTHHYSKFADSNGFIGTHTEGKKNGDYLNNLMIGIFSLNKGGRMDFYSFTCLLMNISMTAKWNSEWNSWVTRA